MNLTRSLPIILTLGLLGLLSIPSEPSPSPLASALQWELKDCRVQETSRGGLVVREPNYPEDSGSMFPMTVTRVWRQHPAAPARLEVELQPSGAHWRGQRTGQHYRWERATPQGPQVEVLAHWDISAHNRQLVQDQVKQTLKEFGQAPTDQVGWFWDRGTSRLFRAQAFRPETLQADLRKAPTAFDLCLFMGPGNDFPGTRPSRLQAWLWNAQTELLSCRDRWQQGMLVDLGWRALELESDPR